MSDKPLLERLQVKRGRRLHAVGVPGGLLHLLADAPQAVSAEVADVLLLFLRDRAELDRIAPPLLAGSRRDAIVWLAYPKLSSRLAADLHRDVIRDWSDGVGCETVAAIAMDADWSALRLKKRST